MEAIVSMLRMCPSRVGKTPGKQQNTVDDADGPTLLHLDQANGSATAQGKTFYFDHVFAPQSSQEEVYRIISPRFQSAFLGLNGCFMTYGQTGTGKSFSVFGSPSEPGVLPRLMKDVFVQVQLQTLRVWITFVEIYQEQLRDLLAPDNNQEKLQCIDHPTLGVMITNLTESPVESPEDVKLLLKFALTRRAVANTNMNSQSSRSHVVFTWRFLINGKLTSKLRFVDLAGSERSHSARTKDQTLEGNAINSSLSVLGLVIKQLTDIQRAQNKSDKPKTKPGDTPSPASRRSSAGHTQADAPAGAATTGDHASRTTSPRIAASRAGGVSWRSSKLTFILKDSLAGNSRSALLATCSGELRNLGETVMTMRFAMQVSSIRTVVRVTTQKDVVVRLKEEIRCLKLRLYGVRASPEHARSVAETEKMIIHLERSFPSQVAEEETRRVKRATQLAAMGVDRADENQSPSQVPFLLNIDKDPLLYGSVLYPLPVGLTSFGNSLKCNIKIAGCGIGQLMCNIVVQLPNPGEIQHRVILQNPNRYRVLLNGNEIVNEALLSNNDRLILGRALAFRLVMPDLSGDGALDAANPESDYEAIMEDDVSTAVHDGHEFWLCMGDAVERMHLLQNVTKKVADLNAVASELEKNIRYSVQLLLGDMDPPILITKTSESKYLRDGEAETRILSHSEFVDEYRNLTDRHHVTFVCSDETQNKPLRRPSKVENLAWTRTKSQGGGSNLGRSSQCIINNLLFPPGPSDHDKATGTPQTAARASISEALMSQAHDNIYIRDRLSLLGGEDDDERIAQDLRSRSTTQITDPAELHRLLSVDYADGRDTPPLPSVAIDDRAPATHDDGIPSNLAASNPTTPGWNFKQLTTEHSETIDFVGASHDTPMPSSGFAVAVQFEPNPKYFAPAHQGSDVPSASNPNNFGRMAAGGWLRRGTDGGLRAKNIMWGVLGSEQQAGTSGLATGSGKKSLSKIELSRTKDMPLARGGIGDERSGGQSWDEALLGARVKMLVNAGGNLLQLPNFATQEKDETHIIPLAKNPSYLLWRKFELVPYSARELSRSYPSNLAYCDRRTR
eukprot:GEMP01001546.1.p1 GENE.GEMP01001546.1~~GEMP01001546.1.p1  ORF type:complete len:1072 (+),score=219.22 GEMP01001546.1:137-3352(+)